MAEEIKDLFGVQEDTEQTATEQNTEVAEETTTEQTEEESADDAEEETEGSAEEPKEEKLTPFQQTILAEMQKRATDDEQLTNGLQSKDKNIADCTKYLNERAKQTIEEGARNGAMCIHVDDDVVYGWAVHYYTESKETIENECPALKPYVPKKVEKTAEQKKAEETTKKVYENPLLSALMKKGAKIANDGEVAVVKTTEKKDAEGNVLSSKTTKTDAKGNRTTTLTKNGQTYTMTEFSLF